MTDRRHDPTLVTQAASSPSAPASRLLEPGEQIGRYTIVTLLGRGGMGAVYEATDPELGRRVAIKVLHDDAGERDALRSEAQALATLVHQHVVMVYDVGVDRDGDVFLVMQLVEGETIDAWIARTRPAHAAILDKFRQAGSGLAAAHAAGLVHCDFKPANVLIDEAGAVRVGDFGLARRGSGIGNTPRGSPIVMTTLAGTPAYMAPEQFEGLVTPATDQFAFCVALWEALAGERPFADPPVATLDPVARGPRRAAPANLPRALRRVLERGLAERAEDRFPSMTALLEALAPRPSRLPLFAGAGLALAGGVAFLASRPDETAPWDAADLAHREILAAMGSNACAYAPMIDPSGLVIFDRTQGETVDLHAVPLAGGPLRQLTTGPHWEWRAQRGRKPGEITYLLHPHQESATSKVMYLDLARGESTGVLQQEALDAITVGDRLFFSPNDNTGIWVATTAGRRPFARPSKGLSYLGLTASWDNTLLAVTRLDANGGAQGAPCVLDTATGTQLRCFDLVTATRPAFGPDANTLYVAALDGIVRLDLITGARTRLSNDYAEGGLAVAADGSALVFSSCRTHTRIIEVPTDTVLVDDPDSAQVSSGADGTLVWAKTIGNTQVLMSRSPTGTIEQHTQPEDGSIANPTLSPNGRYAVFGMSPPNPGLHIVELARLGSLRGVTDDARDTTPIWLDDDHLAFSQQDDGGDAKLFTIPITGGARTTVSSATRWLYGRKNHELLVGSLKGTFWLDPATLRERPGPPSPPSELETLNGSTSPSGIWVVYQAGSDGHALYRTRADGSTPLELVHQFDSSYYVNRPAVTDDGKVIVAAGPMYGDLIKIPAKPGSSF